MAKSEFSGRTEEERLAFAGFFLQHESDQEQALKENAASFIKEFSSRAVLPEIGTMTEEEVRNLIASRYQQSSER